MVRPPKQPLRPSRPLKRRAASQNGVTVGQNGTATAEPRVEQATFDRGEDREQNRDRNRDNNRGRDNQRDGQNRDANRDRDGSQNRDRNRDNQRDNQSRDIQTRDGNREGQNRDNRDNQGRDNRADNQRNRQQDQNDRGEEGDGRRRRRRGRDRDRNRDTQTGRDTSRNRGRGERFDPEPTISEDDVLVPAAGILDVLDNYAFVRTSGYLPGPNDVYVALSMVKRYGLRKGDAITGAVKQPQEGERKEKFNPLVRIDTVNGADPEIAKQRQDFTKLTPLYPTERLRLETEPAAHHPDRRHRQPDRQGPAWPDRLAAEGR